MSLDIRLVRQQRRRLERTAAKERDVAIKQRYLILLALDKRQTPTQIHDVLGVAGSAVYRLAKRFAQEGEQGLRGHRKEAPPVRLTEEYMQRLEELIYKSPRDYDWQRSTWTCELLAKQLAEDTGIDFHRTHVWRLLRLCGLRWGRPRPVSPAWANPRKKTRRARQIERMIDDLPPDKVAVYQDEVDIHLNPKIGPCWMAAGIQFEVETPGKNKKAYLFGGLNPKTGHVVWLPSERKNSAAFILDSEARG